SYRQTFKYFYTQHEGTPLRIVRAVGFFDGPSVAEYMDVRIRTFSGYSPAGTRTKSAYVLKGGGTTYITQEISTPPPTYREMSCYLEFRRNPNGNHSDNKVYARLLFIGQFD